MTHVNKLRPVFTPWVRRIWALLWLLAGAAVVGGSVVAVAYLMTGQASWPAFALIAVGDLARQLLDAWVRVRRRTGRTGGARPAS